MNNLLKIVLIIPVVLVCNCGSSRDNVDILQFEIDRMMDFAQSQYAKATLSLTDASKMPITCNADGSWNQHETSHWVSGFFPGILWYLYEYSGDEKWEKEARKWNAAIEKEKTNTGTHDLGFMLYCSFGNGFRLTGDEHYKEILLQGAQSLISRFNPVTGTIKSWNSKPSFFKKRTM